MSDDWLRGFKIYHYHHYHKHKEQHAPASTSNRLGNNISTMTADSASIAHLLTGANACVPMYLLMLPFITVLFQQCSYKMRTNKATFFTSYYSFSNINIFSTDDFNCETSSPHSGNFLDFFQYV